MTALRLKIQKGLTRKQALGEAKKMLKKRGISKDFRGFTYESKTGMATLT